MSYLVRIFALFVRLIHEKKFSMPLWDVSLKLTRISCVLSVRTGACSPCWKWVCLVWTPVPCTRSCWTSRRQTRTAGSMWTASGWRGADLSLALPAVCTCTQTPQTSARTGWRLQSLSAEWNSPTNSTVADRSVQDFLYTPQQWAMRNIYPMYQISHDHFLLLVVLNLFKRSDGSSINDACHIKSYALKTFCSHKGYSFSKYHLHFQYCSISFFIFILFCL